MYDFYIYAIYKLEKKNALLCVYFIQVDNIIYEKNSQWVWIQYHNLYI